MSHYADSKMESACLHQDVSTTLRGQQTISLRLIRLLCHLAAVVVGCGGERVRLIQVVLLCTKHHNTQRTLDVSIVASSLK